MSRSLSDPLFERLLRSFPPDRAYTREDWSDSAMPEPVSHFLEQLLDQYSRREARRLRRARSDWVDYDHPEMEQAVRTFFEAMETHIQVPADAWEKTLRKATRHATAHLVRPVPVLVNFVFGDREEALRIAEIRWRMAFFGPYSYLPKAVRAFAEKKDLDTFEPARFEQFLHHIDERVTADFDANRWLQLLDPLFQTARYATDRERIPIPFLRTFFAEKGADSIVERLKTYGEKGRDEVGSKTLFRLIEAATAEPDPEPPPRTKEQSASAPDRTPTSPSGTAETTGDASASSDDEIWDVAGAAQPEGQGDSGAAQEDEATPLWKRFQQGRTEAPGNGSEADDRRQPLWAQYQRGEKKRVSEAVTEEDASKPEEESSSSAEPVASSPSGASAAEDGPASDSSGASAPPSSEDVDAAPNAEDVETLEREILGSTDPPHRAVYVRRLFNGDKTAYRQVLERLRTAESWGEASQIIASDVFREHKVNIYSDAAVHFTNAVESCFREH